jgi:hypothetical protein
MKELHTGYNYKALFVDETGSVEYPKDVVFVNDFGGIAIVSTKKGCGRGETFEILGASPSKECALWLALESVITDHRKALEKLILLCKSLGVDCKDILKEHSLTKTEVPGFFIDKQNKEKTFTATSEMYFDDFEMKLAVPKHCVEFVQD